MKIDSIKVSCIIWSLMSVLMSYPALGSEDIELQKDNRVRSYERIVKDHQGNAILKMSCQYLGKEPIGDFWFKVPWKEVDTDFYTFSFENLTASNIKLISQKIHQRYGQPLKWLKQQQNGSILEYKTLPGDTFIDFSKKPYLEDRLILPHEQRIQLNRFYHTNNTMPFNMLTFIYKIEYKGLEYSFNFHLIYRK